MPAYEAEMADFERYDAQVVGISVDSVPSHVAFAKSLGGIEKYPLLADFHPKGAVSKKYGVWKEDRGISERTIVIVDKKGIVRYIDVHAISEAPDNAQLLEVLRELD
jgi:alkyl hydroperoxide reductase subunit AhpC